MTLFTKSVTNNSSSSSSMLTIAKIYTARINPEQDEKGLITVILSASEESCALLVIPALLCPSEALAKEGAGIYANNLHSMDPQSCCPSTRSGLPVEDDK